MTPAVLAALGFPIGTVCVATGCTSLLTVPLLVACGLEPRRAVATNMMALTFLSLGGALSCRDIVASENRRELGTLVVLTLLGSALGAWLLVLVPGSSLRGILLVLVPLAGGLVFARQSPVAFRIPKRWSQALGPLVILVLAVYGGFFSGGYATLLVAALAGLYGMGMMRSFAVSKVLNTVSSATAAAIFAREGLIDWPVATLLATAMFAGGMFGGSLARRLGEAWLRALFFLGLGALALNFAFASGRRKP